MRHRQPVEQWQLRPAGGQPVGCIRGGERGLRIESDDGVDRRVHFFDPRQMRSQGLAGRKVPTADARHQIRGGQVQNLGHASSFLT
jgi:hypothetical protein